MKALIVAESDAIIDNFSRYFSDLGYDIIKYRWLMKALDNVEEIDPQIVIISALDYPRHWKTFVQFVKSSVCSNPPEIVLVSPVDFLDSEEKEKAIFLGVKCIVSGTENKEDDQKLSIFSINETIPQITTVKVEPLNENEASEKPLQEQTSKTEFEEKLILENTESITKFIFTLPDSKSIVTGKVIKFDYPTLFFLPSNPEVFSHIRFGQVINSCTLKTGNFTESIRSQIRGINDTIEFCLLK